MLWLVIADYNRFHCSGNITGNFNDVSKPDGVLKLVWTCFMHNPE